MSTLAKLVGRLEATRLTVRKLEQQIAVELNLTPARGRGRVVSSGLTDDTFNDGDEPLTARKMARKKPQKAEVTDDQIRSALRLMDGERTLASIANEVGIPAAKLYKYCGTPTPAKAAAMTKANQMLAQGEKPTEIAAALKVSTALGYSIISDAKQWERANTIRKQLRAEIAPPAVRETSVLESSKKQKTSAPKSEYVHPKHDEIVSRIKRGDHLKAIKKDLHVGSDVLQKIKYSITRPA